MKVGIVGAEGAKFTPNGEARAKHIIRELLSRPGVTHVVSGHCHLGGIDIWAEEIGQELGLQPEIYPPKDLNWSTGFKPRNIQIAANSDEVWCLTVDKLPEGFRGMKFQECYHCRKHGRPSKDHVKSGGCWTVIEAIRRGKDGGWMTVSNE